MKNIMKNFFPFTFILFLFSSSGIIAQDIVSPKPEKNVPITVSQSFISKFPQKEPIWFTQYQGRYSDKLVYEARFIFDNRYSTAVYNRDGNLIAFAATIETSEVPNKAIAYMKTNYSKHEITQAMTVSRDDMEATVELGIYINNRFTVVVFDKDGNFIKTTLG
jgi:hypothetical protein